MLIKLRLHPYEKEHSELEKAIKKLIDASPDPKDGEAVEVQQKLAANFAKARDKVLTTTQAILKKEWNRVRIGE